MSFSAIKDNKQVYANKFSDEEWVKLKKDKSHGLILQCCKTDAVIVEKSGLRYFDHKKDSTCSIKSKSYLAYMKNKSQIIECLEKSGWNVETEVLIGTDHFAEIYATKNESKLVIKLEYKVEGTGECTDSPSHSKLEVEQVTQELWNKHKVKVLWLIEFEQELDDVALQQKLKCYGELATVFAVKKKTSKQLMIFGLHKINAKNNRHNYRVLGAIEDIKFVDFLNAFFVEKRVFSRVIMPNHYKVYFDYINIKCEICRSNLVGLNYINILCQFSDHKQPSLMMVGNFWYTKAHIPEVQAAVNTLLEQNKQNTQYRYHEYYDDKAFKDVKKLRQICMVCKSWYGIIATNINFKKNPLYTSKSIDIFQSIDNDLIPQDLSGRIWIID
jgi:hypothetical protein